MGAASMSSSLLSTAREADSGPLGEPSLARAFASFTEAAGALEHSYAQLQEEVARLRHELEETNRDLAGSLEENRRMRERLTCILEGLPCGVVVKEADGRIAIANPEAQRLLGAAPGAALPGWLCDWLERARPACGELECHSDEGAVEWLAIRCASLGTKAEASSVFILQRITGVKRLEQEHARLRRRQALAEMSALLAHEIRNPLGSLELFAGLLAESGLDAERRGWVEHLQAGLRTLGATVNNVLHFHSQPQPELAPADLGELLSAVHAFLQPLAQQARVQLDLVNHLDGVCIAADRHRLEQVLLNLALNSFRFMPGGGCVRFAGKMDHVRAVIEVADTGPGIAPEILGHIFEPGFTTRAGSPGLGLAVCRTIVEQHGGRISVASQPGCGAAFTLCFPLAGDSRSGASQ